MIPEDWPKWKKTAVVSGTLSGGIALFTPVIEWGLSNFGISFGWLTWLANSVVATVDMPVWSILLFFLIVGVGYYCWSYLYSEDDAPLLSKEDIQEIKNRAEERPDWKDYTSDHIEGVHWTWEWKGDEVHGLTSLCPECSMQIHPSAVTEMIEDAPLSIRYSETFQTVGSNIECEGCGFKHEWEKGPGEMEHFVRKEIERRVRTEEYQV